jgi:hypothetical protein
MAGGEVEFGARPFALFVLFVAKSAAKPRYAMATSDALAQRKALGDEETHSLPLAA